MRKRILIVDNEKDFVEVLAETLKSAGSTITVDSAYSVNEAQEKVLNCQYDLIITDIRMPHKSGMDLLIFLREITFPGQVYAMTAYNAQENESHLRSLGANEVFAKPFSLNWLKRKVEISFGQNSRSPFEPISLISILQMINLDHKDAMVVVETDQISSSIFLKKGEIIHAEYEDQIGEAALMRIIALSEQAEIFICPFKQKRVHNTIKLNFIEQLMQVIRLSDELTNRQTHQAAPPAPQQAGIDRQRAQSLIDKAQMIKGFWGIALFNAQGEQLGLYCQQASLNLTHIGNQLLDTLFYTSQLSRATGVGQPSMVHIETSDGFSALLHSHHSPFQPAIHTILLLQPDADIQEAKRNLNTLCTEILFPETPVDHFTD